MEYTTLGAVDLGSNSFHLAIARVVDEQLYPLDSMRDTVRLGSGLEPDRMLDGLAQDRALATLKRFSERLAGMPRESVRAVGTNALRVAKNSSAFIGRAEAVLGFPIEVIPGREEARLIYLGVARSLPRVEHNRLVVDIGGGSTEFIIGSKLRPRLTESLYMGCVSFTARFFPDGRIDKKALRRAEFAAREEVQAIAARYQRVGWNEAVGSSGTVRSVAEVLLRNGLTARGISAVGLAWLRERLLAAGDFRKLEGLGVREDRIPVVAGGFAIISGIFEELGLEEMTVAEGALRDGVLWDLLGRVQHRDIREVTVEQFARRYHVDLAQAERVAQLAHQLLEALDDKDAELAAVSGFLGWAARLHEIGTSIAQGAYHKHSAYILANADMPGFSRQEQGWLSNLVLAQRGKLGKMRAAFADDPRLASLAFCLRLAVIIYRSRRALELPRLRASRNARNLHLEIEGRWLSEHTLVAMALDADRSQWESVGLPLDIVET